MKKSILFLLAAAMPVFAQGPAPEAAPAPAPVAGAPVDANNDGVISTEEAIAARDAYVAGNAGKLDKKPGMRRGHRHGKPGMKHEGRRPHGPKAGKNEGRRPMGPKAGKFGPQAPKCGKFQGRKPGMNKGFRPEGPKAPKCGKFQGRKPGMHKGFRPVCPKAGNFGPKAPKCGKFQGRKPGMHKGFRPEGTKAPQFNGCRCGKKHAPGVQPRGCKKAA